MNAFKTIRSNNFALVLAVLSVLVQSPHSYTAFYNLSSLKGSVFGIIQAALFAIVVDIAILFYTARRRRDVVMFASVFLFFINADYYYTHLGFTWELLFAAFLSILIPVMQYYYSEEIRDESPVEDTIHKLQVENSTLKAANSKLLEENAELDAHLDRRLDALDEAKKNSADRDFWKARHDELIKKGLSQVSTDEETHVDASLLGIDDHSKDAEPYLKGGHWDPTTSTKPII